MSQLIDIIKSMEDINNIDKDKLSIEELFNNRFELQRLRNEAINILDEMEARQSTYKKKNRI